MRETWTWTGEIEEASRAVEFHGGGSARWHGGLVAGADGHVLWLPAGDLRHLLLAISSTPPARPLHAVCGTALYTWPSCQ